MSDTKTPESGLTYRQAGVDIDAGNSLVERIKPAVKATHRAGVMGQIGGFGGLFELPTDRYKRPVLVSGTDGVGTKLRLAIDANIHTGIGIDLVAMCANDIVVTGAEPLYFLDYYATGRLELDTATAVIESIAKGCQLAGMALIGGETAEMPGMYESGDYDLAGFAVGIAERDQIISGDQVAQGDTLIGLASSGPHANGYSLIRRVLEHSGESLDDDLDGQPLRERLLAPTRIYVKSLLSLIEQVPVKAIAHITGGGLLENIPRVLPSDCRAVLQRDAWQPGAVFEWLQSRGNIADVEMWRTFNCGVGMVVCVASDQADAALSHLKQAGEEAFVIGNIQSRESAEQEQVAVL